LWGGDAKQQEEQNKTKKAEKIGTVFPLSD
jgi:hypothetical protein